MNAQATIPVLSLLVAALAVFVGPTIAWLIARRQIRASAELASRQLLAPMRQHWIGTLRDLLAELASRALTYQLAGARERDEDEFAHLELLRHKLLLMLNPHEADHERLEQVLERLLFTLDVGDRDDFAAIHDELTALSRAILKTEWDRIKAPLAPL